jgi:hypothetical protein
MIVSAENNCGWPPYYLQRMDRGFGALRPVWDRAALADEADPEAQRILPTSDALHVHW